MIFKRLQELYHSVETCEYTKQDQAKVKNNDKNKKDNLLDPMEGVNLFGHLLQKTANNKGKVFVIGNGGSAGIASHFATDLLKGLNIPALTLFDSNIMTCLSNDYGYERVFSVPLERLMKKEDLLVAISSSGQSLNILNAAEVAQEKKASLITLSGFLSDNPLREMGDLNIWINAEDYGLVETGHFFILHTIVDLWKTDYFTKSIKDQLAYAK